MNRFEFEKWIESIRILGMKPGLSRVKSLLNRMDNPQNKLDIIHITGTNGKGSTATLLSNIFYENAIKVGQFSTPSILGFNHMFLVNNVPIKDDLLFALVLKIQSCIEEMLIEGEEHPTEYEIIAAIMYQYFYDEHVDFAIVEVAMGGENDCTNVMDYSILSMITPISQDHGAFLGHSLKEIAVEKSGVIKSNSVLITHPQSDEVMAVLKKVCDEKMSVLIDFTYDDSIEIVKDEQSFDYQGGKVVSKLLGLHQKSNIIGVIEAVKNLNKRGYTAITNEVILRGIYNTSFAGRFERIDDWIIDGAHNEESLKALASTFELLKLKDLTGVIGVLKDKNLIQGLKQLLPYFKRLIVTEPNNIRKLSSDDLSKTLKTIGFNIVSLHASIEEAYESSLQYEGIKVGFGSFYMIDELRKMIKSIQ